MGKSKMRYLRFCLTPLFIICFASCSLYTPDPTLVRASSDDREDYYDRAVFQTGDFSFETENFLRSNLYDSILKNDPDKLVMWLDYQYHSTGDRKLLTYLADICCNVGLDMHNDEKALPYFLSAAYYSYLYLFTESHDKMNGTILRSKFDPVNCQLLSLFNISTAKVFNFMYHRKLIRKDSYELNTVTGLHILFSPIQSELPFDLSAYQNFESCAKYRINNIDLLNQRFGIGIPLITEIKPWQPYKSVKVPGNFPMAATAVLRFDLSQQTKRLDGDCLPAHFEIYDTFITEKLKVGEEIVPLYLDFTTPITAFSHVIQQNENIISYMLNPILGKQTGGLYMLEPYNPKKIPVIFIHGLLSAPTTWVRMVNVLRSYPYIRRNYQFWFYKYSSGNPILVSASQFQKDLYAAEKEFAVTPEAKQSFSEMVLVGHSMGGLISRVVLMDNPYYLLEEFSQKKWEDISHDLSEADKNIVENAVFHKPSFVSRFVMMAVPHRGANMAAWSIVRMFGHMVELQKNFIDQTGELLESVTELTFDKSLDWDELAENGIDNLDPDNTFIRLVSRASFAKGIPRHSIIGNQEKANIPGGTDGIVTYESAHIDNVDTEQVVKSGHSVQRTPEAIQILAQILRVHLTEAKKHGFPAVEESMAMLKSLPGQRKHLQPLPEPPKNETPEAEKGKKTTEKQ